MNNKFNNTSYIPINIFKTSLNKNKINYFIEFLNHSFINQLFGIDITNKLIDKYCIGTSNYWKGSTVFWQKDISQNIRTGKIILYDPYTGKLKKDYITWAHTVLEIPNFNLNQCFFGEHLLLTDKSKPIAIVASEKSAAIASTFMPQYIWLSCDINSLTTEKCSVLKGRTVTVFPDLGEYDNWIKKTTDIRKQLNLSINASDLFEKSATQKQKEQKFDIADILIYEMNIKNKLSSSNVETIKQHNNLYQTKIIDKEIIHTHKHEISIKEETSKDRVNRIKTEAYKLYWLNDVSLSEVAKIIGIKDKFMPQLLLDIKYEFDDPLKDESQKHHFTL